jgi:Tol biopolymer transport system component
VRNLWKIRVDPQTSRMVGERERLTIGAGQDTDLALSADAKKLAFTIRTEQTRIWSFPFDATAGQIKGKGQPESPAGMDAFMPDLTQDGRRLLFAAVHAGKDELWEKTLTDGRETLLAADSYRFSPRWSRDGTRMAYRRSSRDRRDNISLVTLPAGGGEEQVNGSIWAIPGDWSADGRWLLSTWSGGRPDAMDLWLLPVGAAPAAETKARLVTSRAGYNLWAPRFSPDERWICFHAVDRKDNAVSTLYVIPAAGGDWTQISDGKDYAAKARWSPNGKNIYFVSPRTGFLNVWGIHFDPVQGKAEGEAFLVKAFESPSQMIFPRVMLADLGLSEDRLVLPLTQVSGNIWVLENVDR